MKKLKSPESLPRTGGEGSTGSRRSFTCGASVFSSFSGGVSPCFHAVQVAFHCSPGPRMALLHLIWGPLTCGSQGCKRPGPALLGSVGSTQHRFPSRVFSHAAFHWVQRCTWGAGSGTPEEQRASSSTHPCGP